jgi:hypothetical protein
MPDIPKKAKVYIRCVIVVGILLLAEAMIVGGRSRDLTRVIAYIALACIVSAWKLRLPKMHGTMSVNFVFILLGVAELSLPETLVMGCLATLVQCVWKSKRRPRVIQLLFNVSAMIISIVTAHGITNALTRKPQQPAFLALAAFLYFISNTALVSMVLTLIENKRFTDVWANCHLWAFPYYVAGAAVAALISAATHSIGWIPALLPLLLMYLAYTYYRLYLNQRAAQQSDAHA